jgi:hypothetical protein
MGHATAAQQNIEVALGAALLVGAGAMALRLVLDRRAAETPERTRLVHDLTARPLPTLAIGMLLFVYPMIRRSRSSTA